MKRKIKIFLLIILLIFTLSCSYASNETNENNEDSTTLSHKFESDKVLKKNQDNKENIKTESQVTSYDSLVSELRTNDENKVVNIKKGTYNIKEEIALKICSYTKKLVINGNGAIMDGSNTKSFLSISRNNKVTINNLIIKNTRGTDQSGAIHTYDDVQLTLNNCSFINCVSTGKGGGLTNRGKTVLNNCVFTSNTAAYGGAIWSTGEYGGSLLIKNSKFTNNKANYQDNHDKTAVIYVVSGGKVDIISNTFERNVGKAIHNYRTTLLINGNTFKNSAFSAPSLTVRGGVIDNYEQNVKISNNKFVNINVTALHLRGGILYNEEGTSSFEKNRVNNLRIKTSGRIDSLNGGIIYNRNAIFTVANNNINNINTGYRVHGGSLYNNIGTLKVYSNVFKTKNTASYEIRGGIAYNDKVGSTSSKFYYGGNTFNPLNSGKVNCANIYNLGISQQTAVPVTKKATRITVNSISTRALNSLIRVTGKYTDNEGKVLKYIPITIKVNGKTFSNNTNANGVYSFRFKATTVGTNNITVSYKGNSRYLGATAKTTFTVLTKKGTKITINSITPKKVNKYVLVTGKYTDNEGKVLKYIPITIKVNGKTFSNNTNANGVYSFRFKATTVGTNNITVSYKGNSIYVGSTARTTFKIQS